MSKIRNTALFLSLVLIVLCIFYIKGNNKADGFILIYTIFITTFMLSRIMFSFLYKSPEKIIPTIYPTVSITIPCKNEEKSIYRTIISCFETSYPIEKIEVIAVNDGSTDNTLKEMIRAKRDAKGKVNIINFLENKGKREGMSAAIKIAKGEFIVQLDSDSFMTKECLKELILPLLDNKIGAVVGHTMPDNGDVNILTKMQVAYYFMSFRALKATESIFDTVFCCSGCCCAYRKEYLLPYLDKWRTETLFGKRFAYGDDRGLTNILIRQGYKTLYNAEATATTIVPEKIKQFIKQQIRWKKGWMINSVRIMPYIIMHKPFIAFTYFIPLFLITLLAPIIAFKSLFLTPIMYGYLPIIYITGILLVSLILITHYKIYEVGKYAGYMIIWSVMNMLLLSYILPYAMINLWNTGWGTR